MSEKKETMLNQIYTKPQLYLLVALRVIIGYHFLYEGFNKLFAASWSSGGFLIQSNWIFSDMFIALANSPTLIVISDFLNIWGLIFIGLGLMLGLFSRYAAFAGAALLLL
ncbi:MAG: DoxX family membrane protein, partial [Melioribacteraceae bacterium]|nr:DoxX family membrane protein [Melioribacteraceae bacterium]